MVGKLIRLYPYEACLAFDGKEDGTAHVRVGTALKVLVSLAKGAVDKIIHRLTFPATVMGTIADRTCFAGMRRADGALVPIVWFHHDNAVLLHAWSDC